ncbi:hypothetical protein BB560_004505, partial [Smittium megazygosporum]
NIDKEAGMKDKFISTKQPIRELQAFPKLLQALSSISENFFCLPLLSGTATNKVCSSQESNQRPT